MLVSSKDLKDAASQGPIYVMLVLGAGVIAAIIPLQEAVKQFSPAEFIAANIIGATLILGAGILYLILSLAAIRALKEASTASTSTATKALEAMQQAADKLSKEDAVTQRAYMDKILSLTQTFGGGSSSAPQAPAPAVTAPPSS
jgi:hypothetical protein